MEVYYRTRNDLYPFHKHTEPNTVYYVEHLVTVTNPDQQERMRSTSKLYRSINCQHLIKLQKVLKEGDESHFLYDFHPTSIERYVKAKSNQIRRLQGEFVCGLNCLSRAGLKADIRIENIGVDSKGCLKLFVCPEGLQELSQEELQQFYSTEKTRIRLQLEEILERNHLRQDVIEVRLEKHPGFVIRGNQLVFPKKEHNNQGPSLQEEAAKQNLAKNIMSEIQRQRVITQKLKHRRQHPNPDKEHLQSQLKGMDKFPVLKDPGDNILSPNRFSFDSDPQGKRQNHRNSTGGYIYHHSKIDPRMISSATETSSNELPTKNEDYRPISSLKKENKSSYHARESQTEEELKAIARRHMESEGVEDEPKIHVTTEMVSKYKMKIVTCQQIQFEGKEGDDIEKLAHEKLIQYQSQHGYPQIMSEQAVHEHQQEEKPKRDDHGPNAELMAKILKAKEKANALKEYAKKKK